MNQPWWTPLRDIHVIHFFLTIHIYKKLRTWCRTWNRPQGSTRGRVPHLESSARVHSRSSAAPGIVRKGPLEVECRAWSRPQGSTRGRVPHLESRASPHSRSSVPSEITRRGPLEVEYPVWTWPLKQHHHSPFPIKGGLGTARPLITSLPFQHHTKPCGQLARLTGRINAVIGNNVVNGLSL